MLNIPSQKQLNLMSLIIIAGIAITGVLSTLTFIQSVDAWHTRFESREECMYFFKTEFLNTTAEAGRMCDKVIPHTNVTISVDNRTANAT
jgi:hypothetical protein